MNAKERAHHLSPKRVWERVRTHLLARSGHEVRALCALGLSALAFLTFVHIADEIIFEGEHAVDRVVMQALRDPHNPAQPIGPPWMEDVMRDITSLGSTSVLTLAVAGTVIFLALVRKFALATYVALASIGGTLCVQGLKILFARDRPDFVPGVAQMTSKSFPSGHSSLSAIVYLTLAVLIARELRPLLLKSYVVVFAFAVSALVGLSRIYLGFHWPSDVVAGWTFGCAWALLCWGVAEWFKQRGQVR